MSKTIMFNNGRQSNDIEMETIDQRQVNHNTEQDGSPDSSQIKYGKIQFDPDEGHAKYAIVSDKETDDTLHKILFIKWKMHTPNIVISVTGGAQNFKLRPSQVKEFRKSLIKAAVNTGGWIISGGTHTGVMKVVGEAIRDHVVAHESDAIALGIATFGVLHHQKDLHDFAVTANKDLTGFHYKLKSVCKQEDSAEKVSLDKHHSHFILVDDDKKDSKFGKEIELRARLERVVAQKKGGSSEKVPIVCILIQGGAGSLKTVHDALKLQTPVIVVDDTGGWANILTKLYDEPFNSVNESLISNLLTDERMKYASNELTTWTNLARGCLMQKRLITIFSLDGDNSVADLDIAILQAIVKEDQGSTKQHLQLALAWNRCDIAQSNILTDDHDEIEGKDMWKFFHDALVKDQTGFIRLFLDYGLELEEHLNEDSLKLLYEDAPNKNKTIERLLKKKKNKEISKHKRVYKLLLGVKDSHDSAETNSSFTREKKEYYEHADKYQSLATGILTKCYENNCKKTVNAVTRKLDSWGNTTCLELTASSNAKDFMSHRAVQSHLEDIWYGIVRKTANGFWSEILFGLRTFSCIFFPILVPTLSLKNSDDDLHKESSTQENDAADKEKLLPGEHKTTQDSQQKMKSKSFKNKLTDLKDKIKSFYNAPFVKFFCNVFFYLVFLLLFASVLLSCTGSTQINAQSCSFRCWVLFIWVIILGLDELRQIMRMKARKKRRKILFWIRRPDNQLDLASFLCFIVGFALLKRSFSHQECQLSARIFMAISFIIYCLRVFSLFAVHADLGPKLLMVTKMLKDLLFFLFIWAVIFFAYGVASQALLYPDEKSAKNKVFGSVYKPYWQLYGELFLSEIDYNPDADEFTCSNANVTDNATDTRMPHCPQENAFVPILSAIYMLLVNVLLLNLLIAMFSYTFEKLIDKTDVIWKFERYYLVEEYYFRPCLVVPFSIFSYIRSIILWLYTCKEDESGIKFVKEIKDKQLTKLLTWEHAQTDSYLEDQKIEEENKSSTRLEKLASKLESLEKKFDYQQKLMQRLSAFESRQTKSEVHIRARTSPYPKSKETEDLIKRFNLEDHLVPWNVPYDGYNPTCYTSPEVKKEPPWADKPFGDDKKNNKLRFNSYDGRSKVDRSSYEGRYMVVDGLPRNPRGRTGLAGRGVLGRYGPNHSAVWAFTRWKRNGKKVRKEKDRRPVIEFISIKRKDTGQWAIPGGMVQSGKNVTETWAREFIKKLLDKSKINSEKEDYFLNFAGIEVFKGYSDDSRNTDNAWIETSVFSFHDNSNSIFGEGKLEHPDEDVEWKEVVSSSLDLFEDQESFIRKVAEFRGAFF
ncbi:transient receptor potential cation channel subfamily M member-like 2 isoform X1 [Clavelina lepadiformis]|uniref:transient receptor potential cation channel subfamily M member-like 2 isoform X1 n=2 Tax=Clavelina lepadiformis TaxID=159417 RepID=UPI00404186DA